MGEPAVIYGTAAENAGVLIMARSLSPHHQALWQAIRDYRRFAMNDLYGSACLSRATIKRFVDRLVSGGYVAKMENDGRQPVIYKLIRDCGVHCPDLDAHGHVRPVSGRQKMWAAMKILKFFTYQDLSLAAAVDQGDARFYCGCLKRAGYVKVSQPAIWGHRPATYMFNAAMNTGPYAPQVRKNKGIFDRNLEGIG